MTLLHCERNGIRYFTLIELLVVIAIISILAAMLLPVLSRAREMGHRTVCLSNQRQVAVAMLMYADEHDEAVPHWETAYPTHLTCRTGWVGWYEGRHQIDSYIGDPSVLYCPSNDQAGQPNDSNWDTFVDGTTAGYGTYPIHQEGDYYATINYSIFVGWARAHPAGERIRYLFGPDEQITELPNSGGDRPYVPAKVRGVDGKSTNDIPMLGDFSLTRYPTLLQAIESGPWIPWEEYDSSTMDGTYTMAHAHRPSTDSWGMNTTFMDGSGRWRGRGQVGPRLNVETSSLTHTYMYVLWY